MLLDDQSLRESLTESLKKEIERVGRELGAPPSAVAIECDFTTLLNALPAKVSKSPGVELHPLPPLALTAEAWRHPATVFARSWSGLRRTEVQLSLSSRENVMSIGSIDVVSQSDLARPRIVSVEAPEGEFSFQLCGVRIVCPEARAYLVSAGKRRIGLAYEGAGELTLKPTCAKSRAMLADFIDAKDEPIALKRLFVVCPSDSAEREPRALELLRRQIDALRPSKVRKVDPKRDRHIAEFLELSINAASPFRDEAPLQGLSPKAGYERAVLIVETEDQVVFAFSFAGDRGSETVIASMPQTGATASFWESRRACHNWFMPRVNHYFFDIYWHPGAMRFDIKCIASISGLKRGRQIRLIMNPACCELQQCLLNGKEVQAALRECAQAEKVSIALASGLFPDAIEGVLDITPPEQADARNRAELTVEYSIDYGSASAAGALGAEHVFADAVVLHGDAVKWFPAGGWATRAPMQSRIEVPEGFTAVSMGNTLTKQIEPGAEVYTYDADFPVLRPAFAVGRFRELVDEAQRRDGIRRPRLSMLFSGQECIARRHLDDLGATVDWAMKYCGEFPYKRLCMVTMPGNRSWATMMVFPNSWLERRVPDYWLLSHEVAHQWWGNAAGALNMDDQWMVEGPATYFSLLWSRDLNMHDPGVKSFKHLAEWIRQFKSPPPISAGFRLGPRFGGLFYLKGAYVLEMLRMAINSDRHFFATLKRWVQDACKRGLTEAGLRSVFEEATGHDLSSLFRLYVHTGELPDAEVEVTNVAVELNRAMISLSAQTKPGSCRLPYPIDVYPKSGRAPHREMVFIGPDFGKYELGVPFADVSRVIGNPEALLLVAEAEQEDVDLYVAPE